MKKLLLTGFEPFLQFPMNPTESIVKALNGKQMGAYEIIGEVLPVDFQISGQQIIDLIEKYQPDAVISLGLAGGRDKITPERIAINVSDGEKDNEGHAPVDEPIADGADGYFTTLPIRKMVNALQEAGLPAQVSNTAGTYLCNHVMYRVLHYTKKQGLQVPAGFIHIPASHELAIQHGRIPSWSEADLLRGVEICIEQLN